MHSRAAGLLVLAAAAILAVPPSRVNATGEKFHVAFIRPMSESQDDTLAAAQGSASSDKSGQTPQDPGLPGTVYQIARTEFEQLPVRGAEETTALQAGVVLDRRTNDLYVRGGGSSELIYYVDGVPLQNAFTGNSSARLSHAAIDGISITTGGLGVDYGWGMSGATNIRTVDGGRRLHGGLEAITDNFHGEKQDYNLYGLSLNGPLIPNSDRLTFAVAGERRWLRDGGAHAGFGGILPNDSYGWWTWNGKLRWKPSETLVARLGTFGSRDNWKYYLPEYYFDIAHAPRSTERNSGFWGEISHDLSTRASYTLRGYWATQDSRIGDGVYFDNLWGYGRPYGNPLYDAAALFWSWDDMQLDPDSLANGVQYPLHTPVRDTVISVRLPNGTTVQKSFVISGDEGSVWDDYVRRQGSYIGGRADLVSQLGANHSLRIGGEFQRHTLRYYHNLFPSQVYQGQPWGFHDIDYYGFDQLGSTEVNGGLNGAKHPVSIAGYARDRIALTDLVVSAGLRLDYLDYNAYALRSLTNPLDPDNLMRLIDTSTTLPPSARDSLALEAGRLTMSDLAKTKAFVRLSPRLGASFQVTDGPLLHFAYGKYFQRPDFGTLYSNFDFLEYKIKTGGYSYVMGNGNLKPSSMASSELGVQQSLGSWLTIDVTGFYRSFEDLVSVLNQPAAPNSYQIYGISGDFTSKGLEFQLGMKRKWGVSGQLKYTVQKAAGTYRPGSSTQQNIAWTTSGVRGGIAGPLDYDQRHKFTAIVDARLGDREGPKLGGFYPLERSGVNLVLNAASGFPYSPVQVYNSVSLASLTPSPSGPLNSRRIPATCRLDLKADKAFPFGGTTLDFYLWVLNVFDRANVLDVYAASGSPNDNGWLSSPSGQAFISAHSGVVDASRMTAEQKYRLRENDPTFYDTPRQIRLGMQVRF